MKRLGPRQWKMLGLRGLSALGVAAVPIGIAAPLSPDWWEGQWWLVLLVLGAAMLWAIWGLRYREPAHTYKQENTQIRLVLGDIFAQDAGAMVGFNTTFDTLVPDVISSTSVQADFARKIYGGSISQLDADLEDGLTSLAPTGKISKVGKQTQYPMGSVVVLPGRGPTKYYCVAYSELDSRNVAHTSIQDIWDSLNSFWDSVDVHANGDPVCVPLIGQGQARVRELTPEISVRLIALSFLLRTKKSRFTSELRIVIRKEERSKINSGEFQAFLTALDAS